jgi:hypothetical protein
MTQPEEHLPEKQQNLSASTSKVNAYPTHPFRRLVIFQLKLAVDALRDIILSPVSIICSLVDLAEKRKGENSYFEKLMVFGRDTEKKINLFEQHQQEEATIDSILDQVEDVVMKKYKDKNISKKTLSAIEKILKPESNKITDKTNRSSTD